MKTTLKLLVAGAVLFSMGNVARAVSQVDYYLWIDSGGVAGNWSLSASVTGGPNGLGAFAVNFENALTGVSVAPRSTNGGVEMAGFESGNGFFNVVGGKQAFARQYTSAIYPVGHPNHPQVVDSTFTQIVNGIGAAPVADSAFGAPANTMVGSANNDGLPVESGFQVQLYTGTYTAGAAATRVKYSSNAVTPPSGSANVAVLGAAAGLMTNQPTNAASVYTAAYPSEVAELATSVYHVIWTPDITGGVGGVPDGVVNSADLNVILTHWQQSGLTPFDRANGELTGDGVVNSADLNQILTNWQQNLYVPPAPGFAPVPEPSVFVMLAGAAVVLGAYRRRAYTRQSA